MNSVLLSALLPHLELVALSLHLHFSQSFIMCLRSKSGQVGGLAYVLFDQRLWSCKTPLWNFKGRFNYTI